MIKQLHWKKSSWLWLGFVFLLAACQGEAAVEEIPASPVPDTNATSDAGLIPEAENDSNTERSRNNELVADTAQYDDYEIISVLPRDAIPAIFNPEFFDVQEADSVYAPDELVMGVEFDGDARAYSIPHLSRHEIVNDEVGGVKIAVTW